MPPRFAYWTIILEGKPTAFRAQEQEDLLPTFKQLQAKHPDAVMMWFGRGRLWTSPGEAQAAQQAPRRKPDWRPGGEHRDPRARFDIPRDERRRRFAAQLRRNELDGGPPKRAGAGDLPRPQDEGRTTEPPRENRPPKRPFGPREGGQGRDRRPQGSSPSDQRARPPQPHDWNEGDQRPRPSQRPDWKQGDQRARPPQRPDWKQGDQRGGPPQQRDRRPGASNSPEGFPRGKFRDPGAGRAPASLPGQKKSGFSGSRESQAPEGSARQKRPSTDRPPNKATWERRPPGDRGSGGKPPMGGKPHGFKPGGAAPRGGFRQDPRKRDGGKPGGGSGRGGGGQSR